MQKLEQHHIIENLEEHAENLIKKGLVTPMRFHGSSVTYPLVFWGGGFWGFDHGKDKKVLAHNWKNMRFSNFY